MSPEPISSLPSSPRPRCHTCLRPLRTCLCHWIRPTSNRVQLLILQHPLEVTQAKGSARLLHLSLRHSRLEVGERFDPAELETWLPAPPGRSWLLYPDTPALLALSAAVAVAAGPPRPTVIGAASALPSAPAASKALSSGAGAAADSAPLCLIVLDATWRKSWRMLCLNPELLRLPRLPLRDPPPSAYAIRRAQRADQRSTLEAVCLALQALEHAPAARYAPLLAAFDGFVAERAAWAHG